MATLPVELVCSPRGLESGAVESLSGYCARQSAHIAVPSGIFVKRALDGVVQDRAPRSQYNVVVNTRAGTMNGCGSLAREVEAGVRLLTDRRELRRLSYSAFADLFGFSDRDLLSRQRRWCSKCWEEDGAEPYERKVWWLAIVDACAVHGSLLDFRCPTCGRAQPALPAVFASMSARTADTTFALTPSRLGRGGQRNVFSGTRVRGRCCARGRGRGAAWRLGREHGAGGCLS